MPLYRKELFYETLSMFTCTTSAQHRGVDSEGEDLRCRSQGPRHTEGLQKRLARLRVLVPRSSVTVASLNAGDRCPLHRRPAPPHWRRAPSHVALPRSPRRTRPRDSATLRPQPVTSWTARLSKESAVRSAHRSTKRTRFEDWRGAPKIQPSRLSPIPLGVPQ